MRSGVWSEQGSRCSHGCMDEPLSNEYKFMVMVHCMVLLAISALLVFIRVLTGAKFIRRPGQ